jgi:hypothetical protein
MGMSAVASGKEQSVAETEREPIGYVFDSIGDWTQDGVKFVHKRGDLVYSGGVIKLDPAYKEAETRGASITIILFNGKREERSLEQFANFAKPIELPRSLGTQTSPIERLLRAIGGLFSGHSEKYLITTVRGTTLLQLHEAVIRLEGEEINLAPVFKDSSAEKYVVRLHSVEGATSEVRNATKGPLTFNWRPSSEAHMAVPGLRPGLWRISVVQPKGEYSLTADAWVLICTPERYNSIVTSFNHVVALTNEWGGRVSVDEVRTFLRAALDALSRQREK